MVGDHRSPDVCDEIGTAVSQRLAQSAGTFAVLVISFAAMLGIYASPAQAAPETIAELGSDASQVDFPLGVAVHQASGGVYVAEGNNRRISKFDSDGDFLLAWGFGVRDGKTAALQTCGPQAAPPQKWCFQSNFVSNNNAGNVLPTAVAVDQVSGNIFVADRTKRRITKFSESGQFVFLVGRNVNATKVALGAGATQAEKNICTSASGDTCTAGASGTGLNEFASPRSLAITSSGIVWVGDTNRLKSFNATTGAPGAEIVLAGAGNTLSLAMNSEEDFYVKSASLTGIRKLAGPNKPVPGELLEILDDLPGLARTVTLDEDDNVYIGDATSPYRFMKFSPAGEQAAQFGAGEVIGSPGYQFEGANALAVGEAAGRLYVASSDTGANSAVQSFPLPEPGPLVETQGVEDILPTTATLTGRINPENDETTYQFEYGTSASYGSSTAIETLIVNGFEGEDVEAQLAELLPSTTYHFRVVAINKCNPSEPAEVCITEGEDRTFATPPAVVIDPQWATDVTAHSAILHAELDPLGVEAEAWLEYGTSEGYGQAISLASLGTGFGAVTRQVALTELQAVTTYHYRFAARDERDGTTYTVFGPDHSFTTQFGGLGFSLADNRAWELVSPPDKHGARLVGGGEIHIQASSDGNGLAYQSSLSTEIDPEGNRILEPSMNLTHRSVDGSWHSEDITSPNDEVSPLAIGNGTEYKLFSEDLSEALVEPRSRTLLSPEASERTPYLRENVDPVAYTPLVTGKEPNANVPPGTEFGGNKNIPGVLVAGVSPDFRHVALVSEVPLVEDVAVSGQTIYEWSNGQIKPVSVLPAAEGGTMVAARQIGSGSGSTRGALSEDGSRVFWSVETAGNISALYVRDTESEESGRLDVKQIDASGIGTAQPIFQGASADGKSVFFTDSRQLTEDASLSGFDLYRCQLPPGSPASGCATLTNISALAEADASTEVEGFALGVAKDAQVIYFVARGVLDTAPNPSGASAISGEPNLYVWQQGEGVRFIATLAEEDKNNWARAFAQSASASPSGRFLAFMSQRSLTGYDNRDATTGEPAQELFRYDSLVDRLECVSCNPNGARPHSATVPEHNSLVDPQELWEVQRTAAILPQAITITVQGVSLYRPRAVLDNGRVFFNAVDSLVSADSNQQWDVYQHEPTGVGDCLESSGGASISRSAGGCISLVSSGAAEEEAAFFDASEVGDDAFFSTPARLSVLDKDKEVDIYDARVNGVEATLSLDAECLGEACQPLAQPPSDPTPASAAFHGPGNLRPAARKHCPKGKRRVKRQGKVRCVARKHRKASATRRTGR
jgi:hypothetical protein